MDHVVLVVEDLEAGIAFFTELGLELEGRTPVEGEWVDRVNGMDDVRVDIAMMRTPDGHGKVELTSFRSPATVAPAPKNDVPNMLGLRSIMFAVDDIDDVIARLRPHGGELVGEVVRYGDVYRLCYLRGPSDVIIALAEELQ
ncbi:VOC family protein [Actinomadura logoneensis]|uniref:VOC family protein n=1 Tax=Actinomadura logoneensis TaxID=2293572 RepID=A0A372JFQ8_9ACTN|nr:VOC family protein [Actinomadura logoneensis]RFU38800.1 VOC family protein [Actinomadura logoneensis]